MAPDPRRERLEAAFRESLETKARAGEEILPATARAVALLVETLGRGGKVLACGNGGSACDAMHLASELVNRLERVRPALPALALVTDPAALTSIANDESFDRVFARQVEALGREGDLLVAISTSGGSPNVLAAARAARLRGLHVLALPGGDGGALAGLLREGGGGRDVEVRVPSSRTTRIQEVHLLLVHCLCEAAEAELAAGA